EPPGDARGRGGGLVTRRVGIMCRPWDEVYPEDRRRLGVVRVRCDGCDLPLALARSSQEVVRPYPDATQLLCARCATSAIGPETQVGSAPEASAEAKRRLPPVDL